MIWLGRDGVPRNMESFYRVCGFTRQNFHQFLDRSLKSIELEENVLKIIAYVRRDHPRMGCREIYRLMQPAGIGRDKFEQLAKRNGLQLVTRRQFMKTTDSKGVIRFKNLIHGMKVTDVNQVWVSDITYYRLGERFYYITLIMDLYSARILGYCLSKDLRTENTTLPSLQMALDERKVMDYKEQLIFHSDGGGQYYSHSFLETTAKYGIKNSMAYRVFENPHAERLNGIIKNDYLIPFAPKTFEGLKETLKRTIGLYNSQRQPKRLGRTSPIDYEIKHKSKVQGHLKIKSRKEVQQKYMKQLNLSNSTGSNDIIT